jgi:hypothetical protein
VWVPSLVQLKQVDVALGIESIFQPLDDGRTSAKTVYPLLLLGMLRLEPLDTPEHNRRQARHRRYGDTLVQRDGKDRPSDLFRLFAKRRPESSGFRFAIAFFLLIPRRSGQALGRKLRQVCGGVRRSPGRHHALTLAWAGGRVGCWRRGRKDFGGRRRDQSKRLSWRCSTSFRRRWSVRGGCDGGEGRGGSADGDTLLSLGFNRVDQPRRGRTGELGVTVRR